jgi:hypothetical protein
MNQRNKNEIEREFLLFIATRENDDENIGCTNSVLRGFCHDYGRRRLITNSLKSKFLIEMSEGRKWKNGNTRNAKRWLLTEKGRSLLQEILAAKPNTTEAARTAVLASLNISRRELARRAAEIGECSEVAVLQWLGGQTNNPTLRTWFAIEAALKT